MLGRRGGGRHQQKAGCPASARGRAYVFSPLEIVRRRKELVGSHHKAIKCKRGRQHRPGLKGRCCSRAPVLRGPLPHSVFIPARSRIVRANLSRGTYASSICQKCEFWLGIVPIRRINGAGLLQRCARIHALPVGDHKCYS